MLKEWIVKTIKNISINGKFLIISIALFIIIFIISGFGFGISMRQNMQNAIGMELSQSSEIERIKLEASVNSEIALVLKMAGSPLIQEYFMNPNNSDLEKSALAEIAGYRSAFKHNSVFWVNDIDLLFYSNDTPPYKVDVNDPVNYWYLMTLNETEIYNFNINYNPDLDVINLWINAPVFNGAGKSIGMLGTGIDLTAFIDSIYDNYTGKADIYFFNALGEITGSKDAELVAEKTGITLALGETGSRIFNKAIELDDKDGIPFFVYHNSIIAVGEVPALGWYIAAMQNLSFNDILKGSMFYVFLLMMGIIAIILIIINLALGRLLNPINEMIISLNNITANYDLTRQLEIRHNYETGILEVLMESFNKFLSKLNKDFFLVNKNVNMVTSSLMELSASSMEISSTANEQSASVVEIVSTMENNKELSAQGAEKTLEVADLAFKTRELCRRGAALRDLNEEMMLDILNQNTKILEIINNLADMLSRIDESIQLIDAIADRTKLIAFNAALEASSAGEESGSRFSVVAGEIRRFADNVVESVAEIKEKISELQEASKMLTMEAKNGANAINLSYKGMVEQKEVFESIVEVSENVAERSQQISGFSKQQEMASAQVFTALKEISAGINQFASSTEIIKAAVDMLNSMSIELEETVSKYKISKGGAQ